MWDLATGRPVAEPLPHPDWVFTARFTADGKHLITACRDGYVRLWDWRKGKVVAPACRHETEVFDLAWLPGERRLMTSNPRQAPQPC